MGQRENKGTNMENFHRFTEKSPHLHIQLLERWCHILTSFVYGDLFTFTLSNLSLSMANILYQDPESK